MTDQETAVMAFSFRLTPEFLKVATVPVIQAVAELVIQLTV